jgi:hypothetical protein
MITEVSPLCKWCIKATYGESKGLWRPATPPPHIHDRAGSLGLHFEDDSKAVAYSARPTHGGAAEWVLRGATSGRILERWFPKKGNETAVLDTPALNYSSPEKP